MLLRIPSTGWFRGPTCEFDLQVVTAGRQVVALL